LYEGFENTTVLSWNKIVNQIKSKYSEANIGESAEKELEILSYTFSGRIDKIRLGDITLSGAEFREIFSLPSTNLEFKFLDNNEVEIISKGYGHGVGMSQCGADYLAKKGLKYDEILGYFYSGITVQELR
jgi:stage II sporulation protein D